MKSIDGDKLLSDLYERMVRSEDVGDVVVRFKDVLDLVRSAQEIPTNYTTPLPAKKYRDYNGYVRCSICGKKLSAVDDIFCGGCGRKFIN